MNAYKKRMTQVALALCCLLFSSCIGEDLSGCAETRTQLRVSFSTDTQEEIPGKGPHNVTLYLFDREGYCCELHEFRLEDLEDETLLETGMPAGEYTFVAWVNKDDPYFDVPVFDGYPQVHPRKEAAVLYLDISQNSIVDYQLPDLFHGALEGQEIGTDGNRVRIPLVLDTNRLSFSVEGLESNADTYEFEVRDNNGAYTFDNGFDACTPFSYMARAAFTGTGGKAGLDASMTILRLAGDRSPAFTFRNRTTGKTLYPSSPAQETNLVRLIQKAYRNSTVDFDRKHRFEITLKYNAQMEAAVSVDGWSVVQDDGDLRP